MSFPLTSSPKNTHILDGEAEDLYAECEAYEDAIKAAGGIDLFLGGIGAGMCAFQNHSTASSERSETLETCTQADPRWTHCVQRAGIVLVLPHPDQDARIRDDP